LHQVLERGGCIHWDQAQSNPLRASENQDAKSIKLAKERCYRSAANTAKPWGHLRVRAFSCLLLGQNQSRAQQRQPLGTPRKPPATRSIHTSTQRANHPARHKGNAVCAYKICLQ
jgi:hypothetical protein